MESLRKNVILYSLYVTLKFQFLTIPTEELCSTNRKKEKIKLRGRKAKLILYFSSLNKICKPTQVSKVCSK